MKVRNKYVLIMILVWGPFLAVAVLFHLLVLVPQIQRVAALEAELVDARSLYSQATEAAKQENQARLAEAVDRVRDRVSDFVLRLEAAPDLAFEIAELASKTQVGAFTMKPREKGSSQGPAQSDRIGEKQIDLSFTSQFDQFAALLNALERHHPVLFVEKFTIRRPRDETMRPEAGIQLAVLVEKPHEG